MENNEKVFAGFLMLMAVWSPLAAFAALVSVIVLRLIFCFSGAEEHHQRYFCIFILIISSLCIIPYVRYSPFLTSFYIGKLCLLDGWNVQDYLLAVKNERRLVLTIAVTAFIYTPLLYAAAFCMRSVLTPRQALRDMQRKAERSRLNPKVVRAVANIESSGERGVLLGATKQKKPFFLSPLELNRHVMLVGTTGSGKTTTIYRFVEYCVNSMQAGIFIDGKGDAGFVSAVKAIADKRGRKIKAFMMSPDGYGAGYNPFCVGSPSEMTDKIISMFDWTEPHYKLSAQRFLQLLFRAFKILDITPDLPTVTQYCDIERLEAALKAAEDEEMQSGKRRPDKKAYNSIDDLDALDSEEDEPTPQTFSPNAQAHGAHDKEAAEIIDALKNIDERAVQGIASRLGVIAEGDLRELLKNDEKELIKIHEILENREIAVFSLDSLRYPEQAREFGRLIINDLKANIAEHMKQRSGQRVTLIFDEFNVFVSAAVVDLVNKSRSAGFEALLSFQSLADIDAAAENGKALAEQIMQNCNTLIIQRQNSADDRFSKVGGTRDAVELTYQAGTTGSTGLGSARLVQEFKIDPNALKNLQTGEAIVKRNVMNADSIERIFIKNTAM